MLFPELLYCVCSYLPVTDVVKIGINVPSYHHTIKRFLTRNCCPLEIIIGYVNQDDEGDLTYHTLSRYEEHIVRITPSLLRYWSAHVNSEGVREFSGNPYLTLAMIEEFVDDWDWKVLSSNLCLTAEIIERYQDRWHWDILSDNKSIFRDLSIIDRYQERWDWTYVSYNANKVPLPIPFLERHLRRWDWSILSSYLILTPETVQHFREQWSLVDLLRNYSLTGEMTEIAFRHNDSKNDSRWFLLNSTDISLEIKKGYMWEMEQSLIKDISVVSNEDLWYDFARYGYLTPTMLELCVQAQGGEHITVRDTWWSSCATNRSLTLDMIEKYFPLTVSDNVWDNILYNPSISSSLTLDFLERHWDKWHLARLSSHERVATLLTVEFIDQHLNEWDWDKLSANTGLALTSELVYYYQEYWNWDKLSANTRLPITPELVYYYQEYWNWHELSTNPVLGRIATPSLLDDHLDQWDWCALIPNILQRQKITIDFIDLPYWEREGMMRRAWRIFCSKITKNTEVLLQPRYRHLLSSTILANESLSLEQLLPVFNDFEDRDEHLLERKDLTAAFLHAHPEIKWNYKMFTCRGKWTWCDVLDYPHLPWDREELLLQTYKRNTESK